MVVAVVTAVELWRPQQQHSRRGAMSTEDAYNNRVSGGWPLAFSCTLFNCIAACIDSLATLQQG